MGIMSCGLELSSPVNLLFQAIFRQTNDILVNSWIKRQPILKILGLLYLSIRMISGLLAVFPSKIKVLGQKNPTIRIPTAPLTIAKTRYVSPV